MSESSQDDRPAFELYCYNPRRHARGKEAAQVMVTWPDGKKQLLWMSPRDIKDNIAEFGDCSGLRLALDAYRNKVEVRPQSHETNH